MRPPRPRVRHALATCLALLLTHPRATMPTISELIDALTASFHPTTTFCAFGARDRHEFPEKPHAPMQVEERALAPWDA